MNGGNWWQDSRSGWLPSVLPPEMCIGSLAHPYGTPDNEPWRGPLTIRAQPLIRQLRPASVWSHYYYTMLLTYCTCTCSVFIIIAILVSLLSPLLSFLSSQHLLSSIPAIHVYKTPSNSLSILTDQDPGFSRNVWIKWLQHRPVIFGLWSFRSF